MLLILLLNGIDDKKLLEDWLNSDSKANELIYKLDIVKLLQLGVVFPAKITNDSNFATFLLNKVINQTGSLIDIRSYIYIIQRTDTEFYTALLNEYNKYSKNLLNSYNKEQHIFDEYFQYLKNNKSYDGYLFSKSVQEKLSRCSSIEEQKKLLEKETSLKISEIVVDSIFEDNIYNVKLNISEILRYTNDIDENLIDRTRLDFYQVILNIDSMNNEDKIKLFHNLKGKNISAMLYDDLQLLKRHSYNSIKNSLTQVDKGTKLSKSKLSDKYGTDIYELNGEKFYMLVKSMEPISQNKYNNYIDLGNNDNGKKNNSDVERGCFSLIGSDNIDVFNRSFVYGFNSFDVNNIISVFETDCFSRESDERILNENYGTTAVNRIMTPHQIVNGLDPDRKTKYSEIQILGKMKPDFIIVFDEINELAIEESKSSNVPIVIIHTEKYNNDKRRFNPFNDDNLQYIDFSGTRETGLRSKRWLFITSFNSSLKF